VKAFCAPCDSACATKAAAAARFFEPAVRLIVLTWKTDPSGGSSALILPPVWSD
jgi:hypothetical protein